MAIDQKEFARQQITRISSQSTITQRDKQLLDHYQRILNVKPLSDEEIAKWEQGKHTQIYQKTEGQTFADWETTIDKNKVTTLRIESSLENNELIIQDYPNLKELYALNCNLDKATIKAPKLEILNLIGNKLKELDLSNTLDNVDGNDISHLKTLTVSENRDLSKIIGLEKLTELENFDCYKCYLTDLNFFNQSKLKFLAAANQFVELFKIKLQGCDNLEILDVAENNITDLDCSNLTKLKDVSCKESCAGYFDAKILTHVDNSINDLLTNDPNLKMTKKLFISILRDFFSSFLSRNNFDAKISAKLKNK